MIENRIKTVDLIDAHAARVRVAHGCVAHGCVAHGCVAHLQIVRLELIHFGAYSVRLS